MRSVLSKCFVYSYYTDSSINIAFAGNWYMGSLPYCASQKDVPDGLVVKTGMSGLGT